MPQTLPRSGEKATEPKESPILFRVPMVKAILDGSKFQTRRLLKLRGVEPVFDSEYGTGSDPASQWIFPGLYEPGSCCPELVTVSDLQGWLKSTCPYGNPGDRLWVKEAYRLLARWDEEKHSEIPASCARPIRYEADGAILGEMREDFVFGRYRSSRFAPRCASRITLEIVEVRVQRLQDISEEDAKAEGVAPLFSHAEIHEPHYCPELDLKPMPFLNYLWHGHFGKHGTGNSKSDAWEHQSSSYETARGSYSSLWESINGKGSWDANPWVRAITFRRLTDGI